jgi:hypothetical protein
MDSILNATFIEEDGIMPGVAVVEGRTDAEEREERVLREPTYVVRSVWKHSSHSAAEL